MILKIQAKWPFLRQLPAGQNGTSLLPSQPPAQVHRSWVKVEGGGIGWIRRHEADGWIIEFSDGEVAKYPFSQVENISPPDDVQ